MSRFVNQSQFDSPWALKLAKDGIKEPERHVIEPGTLIYRYGTDLANAANGIWWLTLEQRNRVTEWAALNQLKLPHAMRIMTATMNEWSPKKAGTPPSFSSMAYLASAVTTRPLLAYLGETKPQFRVNDAGNLMEGLAAATMTPAMTQLSIPGLGEIDPCGEALSYSAIIEIDVEASKFLPEITTTKGMAVR